MQMADQGREERRFQEASRLLSQAVQLSGVVMSYGDSGSRSVPKLGFFSELWASSVPKRWFFSFSVSLAFFPAYNWTIDHLARFVPKTGCFRAVSTGFFLIVII